MKSAVAFGIYVALFLLVVSLCISVLADSVIDVVDGHLLAQGYRIALGDKQTTITLKMEQDEDILCVETKDMTTVLRLGTRDIVISESASPYVTDLRYIDPSESPPPAKSPQQRFCKTCGEADLSQHFCPRCNIAYCLHDDINCSYRLNPVPTENPLFKKEKGAEDALDDGTWYSGYDIPNEKAVKNEEWSPGLAFSKAHATASPNPDDIYAPPD